MKKTVLLRFMITTLALAGVFSFSVHAKAADLVRPADQQALEEFVSKVDNESLYRSRIDREGKQWAEELMLMYKWSALYPMNLRAMPDTPESKAALALRMKSELAWMTIAGHGLLATFDFKYAQQSFTGSTSRFTSALMTSASFWTEVRNQCIEIAELQRKAAGLTTDGINIKGCAARLKRDIDLSQAIGSNVSLFAGGGIVIGLGKKLFQRYASTWVTARVVPLIPAFAKTRWALGALTVGIVVVPAGLIVASVTGELETGKVFFENIQTSLNENNAEAEKASILHMEALAMERRVLDFAIWVKPRVPKVMDDDLATRFLTDVRFSAPHFAKLSEQQAELEARRASLEAELGRIPGISAKLLALAEARKHQSLSEADAKLFRSAQYLASLRLTLKIIVATKNT